MEYNSDNLTELLIAKGYTTTAIAEIVNGYSNGFEDILKVNNTVDSNEIKKLIKASYKVEDKKQLNTLIKIVNTHAPLDIFIDKPHRVDVLETMLEDYLNGRNIELYMSRYSKNDFSDRKIRTLRNVRDLKEYNYLTTEEKMELKNFDEDDLKKIALILRNPSDKMILSYMKDTGNLDKSLILLDLHKNYPELEDKLSKYKPFQIKAITEKYDSDPKLVLDFLKISDETLSVDQIKNLFIKLDNEKINLDEILSRKLAPADNIKYINFQLAGLDLDFVDNFTLYNIFTERDFIEIVEKLESKDATTLSFVINELENNKDATCDDVLEILSGIENGIDVSIYTTNLQLKYPYTAEEKKLLKNVLIYNKNHPSEQIDLNDIIDEYDSEFKIEKNLYELSDLLERNINITPFITSLLEYSIDEFHEAVIEFNLSQEKIKLLLGYMDYAQNESDIYFLAGLLEQDCEIVDEHDIYKKSVNIFKTLDNLKSNDSFCAEIIDNQLTENNCESLIKILDYYTKLPDNLKLTYQKIISAGIYEKFDEDMPNEKLNAIADIISSGVPYCKYMANNYSLEQIKILGEISQYKNNVEMDYDRHRIERIQMKIHDPKFSVEQLEYLKDKIMNSTIEPSIISSEYSVESMEYYSKCADKFTIYNYSLYDQDISADRMISSEYESAFKKIDKSLPLKEQQKQMTQAEIKILEKVAEKANMDGKIIIYNTIKAKEDIENTEINIER